MSNKIGTLLSKINKQLLGFFSKFADYDHTRSGAETCKILIVPKLSSISDKDYLPTVNPDLTLFELKRMGRRIRVGKEHFCSASAWYSL